MTDDDIAVYATAPERDDPDLSRNPIVQKIESLKNAGWDREQINSMMLAERLKNRSRSRHG